jgi:hypothetical protein
MKPLFKIIEFVRQNGLPDAADEVHEEVHVVDAVQSVGQ